MNYPHSFARRVLTLVAAFGLGALTLSAQTGTVELKRSDRHFLEKAAKASQAELQISQIATERAGNPQVREFAQMIVSEHQQLNRELTDLAAAKGVTLPVSAAKLDKWSAKKANEFDKDYVNEMVSQHDEAVSLFEKAVKSEDPEIAAFAQKYLPKLQAHHTAAKDFKKLY